MQLDEQQAATDPSRPPPAPPARGMALATKQRGTRRRKGCLLAVSIVILVALACPAGIVGTILASDRYSAKPRQVRGLRDVTAIAAGWEFSLALRKDGTVWAWGDNEYGQLGIGGTKDQGTPKLVPLPNRATAIAAGGRNGFAVADDGTVWSWGTSDLKLGTGYGWVGLPQHGVCVAYRDSFRSPERVPGLGGVTAIVAGDTHILALTATGEVWGWGSNEAAQAGGGGGNCYAPATPARISNLPRPATAIAVGDDHSLVLLADGTVYSWGGDTFGQLSDGKVGQGFNSIPARVVGLEGVKAIAAGAVGVSMAVTQEPSGQATVWVWGRGAGGETCVKDHQVPAPRATTRTVQVLLPCGGAPVKATGLPSIAMVAARSGRTERSSALWRHWYWDTGTASVPRACDQYDFCRDTALLAIADDGQLWAWDNGRTGGMNVVTSQQVGLGDVRSLATGRSHYLALRADGTVWAWGLDGSGQLGN